MSKSTPSPQKIFLWNILGSLSTAAISVLLLLVVSRTLSDFEADIFSIAYAIGNLLNIVGSFQVRNFQATDIKGKYQFYDYLMARIWTCALMMAATFIYIYWQQYDSYKSFVILLISLYRMTDAFSDVFQGLFQQKERLDIAGKSLCYRNILLFLVFSCALFMTKNLLVSLFLLCLVSICFIFVYDISYTKQFLEISLKSRDRRIVLLLLKENLPLFINAFLLVYIYNQPKYSLDGLLEAGVVEQGIQKDFNILFMPVFVMNLMMFFLRPMLTKLAIHREKKDIEGYQSLKRNIFLILFLFTGLVFLGSYFLGIPVLSILYSTPLHQYKESFLILMLGGILSSFATVFDNLLTVLRKQKVLVVSFASSFLVSLFLSDHLVRSYSVFGAALSFLVSMSVWLIISIIIYQLVKDKEF
nr:lipopolysaccharide biosynthesis protein [Streptococcus himalayensis]